MRTQRADGGGEGRACATCRHWDDDPTSLERRLSGWSILGSASGSARGRAGLCNAQGRFMEPVSACERYDPWQAGRDGDGSAA